MMLRMEIMYRSYQNLCSRKGKKAITLGRVGERTQDYILVGGCHLNTILILLKSHHLCLCLNYAWWRLDHDSLTLDQSSLKNLTRVRRDEVHCIEHCNGPLCTIRPNVCNSQSIDVIFNYKFPMWEFILYMFNKGDHWINHFRPCLPKPHPTKSNYRTTISTRGGILRWRTLVQTVLVHMPMIDFYIFIFTFCIIL